MFCSVSFVCVSFLFLVQFLLFVIILFVFRLCFVGGLLVPWNSGSTVGSLGSAVGPLGFLGVRLGLLGSLWGSFGVLWEYLNCTLSLFCGFFGPLRDLKGRLKGSKGPLKDP